jgi:hypothetical protein
VRVDPTGERRRKIAKALSHSTFLPGGGDWAGETTAFPPDVCEAAIAHVRGDKNVRAYARGDLFNRRRQLMDAWARHCTTPVKTSGEVTQLPSA